MKKIEFPAAVTPPSWEVADAAALQALAKGEADEAQQKRALNWLLHNACGTYDADYRPDDREHAFVSGRRFVGLQVVKLLHINTAALSTKRQAEQS